MGQSAMVNLFFVTPANAGVMKKVAGWARRLRLPCSNPAGKVEWRVGTNDISTPR